MDSVVLGSILTIIGSLIVFIYLAMKIRTLMNQKPDQ